MALACIALIVMGAYSIIDGRPFGPVLVGCLALLLLHVAKLEAEATRGRR